MAPAVVVEALAAKEELLRFMDGQFVPWLQANQEQDTQFGRIWPTDQEGRRARRLLTGVAQRAEIFAVDPVMSAVVKMAAEDLPNDASFVPDDLPTKHGVLFFGESLPVTANDLDHLAGLDTIMWSMQPPGLLVTAWSLMQSRSHAFTPRRIPIAVGVLGYKQRINEFFTPTARGDAKPLLDGLTLACAHALAALRIMQQPYAGRLREHVPRAAARRLARQSAASDITVISFRKMQHPSEPESGTAGNPLGHRVLVRGHWRLQHYKTPEGTMATKQVYIGPYVRGPEDTPLVVTKKVNDLLR